MMMENKIVNECSKRGYTDHEYDLFLKINAVARKLALKECYLYPEGFDFRRCVYVEKEDDSGMYLPINIDEERWFAQACEVIKLIYQPVGDCDFVDSIPLEIKNVYFNSHSLLEAHKECLRFRRDFSSHGYYRSLYTRNMESKLRDLNHYGILSECTISIISRNLKERTALKIT